MNNEKLLKLRNKSVQGQRELQGEYGKTVRLKTNSIFHL